jgi:hypothetical protein
MIEAINGTQTEVFYTRRMLFVAKHSQHKVTQYNLTTTLAFGTR